MSYFPWDFPASGTAYSSPHQGKLRLDLQVSPKQALKGYDPGLLFLVSLFSCTAQDEAWLFQPGWLGGKKLAQYSVTFRFTTPNLPRAIWQCPPCPNTVN